jgi:hypothetical protein
MVGAVGKETDQSAVRILVVLAVRNLPAERKI